MEALEILAGRVSSLDAVILGLVWGIVKVVTMPGDKRTSAVMLALKILGLLALGAFASRVALFLADQNII